ncbi:MAG TPA: peptidyl-alpha-hydroxyglycine alpha-amidating lyase family protein [Gemmataceae bacterium]|jgi:DNA-binding beta-propeller fold protein YncE|nr:peptidyl-alpha-hydroxyglycine alpha-amidating lyase family protein [Gemmataceae bacterium]
MNTNSDCREFGYVADDHWAKLPAGISWMEVAAVAVDSRDRVYVFNRGDHPVLVFDLDGNLLTSWGEGVFVRPHGLTIGPDDSVYCTDDLGHVVHKFTPDGRLLLTLGTKGLPSDTGATSIDFRTITHAGPPFHYPTNLALAPEGNLYITDGYGNARVHFFAPDGRLLFSWGEPGTGPGQFRVPHGIAIDKHGTLFVCDRENSRIQLFTPEGKYLSEWTDVIRPSQVFIDKAGDVFVAELGYRAGMWPGTKAPSPDAPGGRVSIFDSHGRLKARWGGGENPCAPGDFFAPHDICLDSRGNIYVTEVVWSAGGNRGLVPADCHALQKFVRQ